MFSLELTAEELDAVRFAVMSDLEIITDDPNNWDEDEGIELNSVLNKIDKLILET